jgi:hypothetical protein
MLVGGMGLSVYARSEAEARDVDVTLDSDRSVPLVSNLNTGLFPVAVTTISASCLAKGVVGDS